MRNVLDESCRENQNTFYVRQLFFENRSVYNVTSKNMVEPEGPQITSKHGAYELHAGSARSQARTRMHTPRSPGTCHAHTQICNIYCFSTAKITPERASMLRYTNIACLVAPVHAVTFATISHILCIICNSLHFQTHTVLTRSMLGLTLTF
jgi:hypothetical protein